PRRGGEGAGGPPRPGAANAGGGGVRLRGLHGPPVGHGAAEETPPGAPRGRGLAARGQAVGRAAVAREERRGRGRGSPPDRPSAERGAAPGGPACRAAKGTAAGGRTRHPARAALTPLPRTRARFVPESRSRSMRRRPRARPHVPNFIGTPLAIES